jgi:hypothetical protein
VLGPRIDGVRIDNPGIEIVIPTPLHEGSPTAPPSTWLSVQESDKEENSTKKLPTRITKRRTNRQPKNQTPNTIIPKTRHPKWPSTKRRRKTRKTKQLQKPGIGSKEKTHPTNKQEKEEEENSGEH